MNPEAKKIEKIRTYITILDTRIELCQNERRAALRDLARAEGRLVDNPTQLSDEELTWEYQKEKRSLWGQLPEMARGYRLIKSEKPTSKIPVESAYFCQSCQGWVRGSPISRKIHNLGGLSAVEGRKHCCGVCEERVGETIFAKA